MTSTTDRIEKQVILRAPQERVWRAISDAGEFGSWFGMEFEGAFAPGREIRGRIVPTKADPDVAKMQEGHAGLPVTLRIERIVPMHTFSYRWHPFAIDPAVDYSAEPMTLIEFVLEDRGAETMLTITESGFDQIPLSRRARAFEANEGGWTGVLRLIAKHLSHASSNDA